MSYLSPEDYGLIGNQGSAALVSRLGSIDWCCFPRLDSPSHFGALVDENQGGRFQLMPQGEFRSEQRYLQRTHVLETVFETPFGRATLTDWMPLGEGENGEPVIHRRLEMIRGKITWLLHCAPRFQYGKDTGLAEHHRDGFLFRGEALGDIARLWSSVPLELARNRASVTARFALHAGHAGQGQEPSRAHFCWRWGLKPIGADLAFDCEKDPSPRVTAETWRGWAHRCVSEGCGLSGPWHDSVSRSALILKLLLNPEIGTLAESVTTSIPGKIGGSRGRTWDYRFAWVRDSASVVQVLANLGYRDECRGFFQWLSDTIVRDGVDGLRSVYRLDGGRPPAELELGHLHGYQGVQPVRVGHHSSSMDQLDIFGHVFLAADEYYRVFHELPARLWPRLAEIASHLCSAWRRPDRGMWEVRSKPEHFVASKVYAWAALDRAIRLAQLLRREVLPRWRQERDILHQTILAQGYDPALGSFVRSFGGSSLDSAALVIPLVGFLPIDDPRIQGTLRAVMGTLSEGLFVRRFQDDEGPQANEGRDPHHLLSSFWLVQCLALAGRADEAGERLADLCGYATPLGLLGEQVDPATGETSGNFPSSLAHLQLINSALYVGAARGRQLAMGHLMGWPDSTRAA